MFGTFIDDRMGRLFGIFEVTVNIVVDKLVTSEESSRVNSMYKRVKMWGRWKKAVVHEQEDESVFLMIIGFVRGKSTGTLISCTGEEISL